LKNFVRKVFITIAGGDVRTVGIWDSTHERLLRVTKVAQVDMAELIDRLTCLFLDGPDHQEVAARAPRSPAEAALEAALEVFVVYKGVRVTGTLDRRTDCLQIVDGPPVLVERTFKSPTQAAVEVVKTINPSRGRPETNGWRFWHSAGDGQIIDRLRAR